MARNAKEEPYTNYTAAVHHFTQAAEAGIKEAHSNLGVMYLQGTGVPYNATEARRHFGVRRLLHAL